MMFPKTFSSSLFLSILFQFLLLISYQFPLTTSLIHHLKLRDDNRNIFKIETFGFIEDGWIDLTITDIALRAPKGYQPLSKNTTTSRSKGKNEDKDDQPPVYFMGFLMRHANSESDAQQDLETSIERGECILDKKTPKDVFLDLSDPKTWKKASLHHQITEENTGLYSLIFARCSPSGLHYLSFKMDATFTNPGPNYLSAGDLPLPTVYLIFFFFHLIAALLWVWVLQRDPIQYGTVHRIHYMMLLLLTFKIFSLLFESIRYHYIAIYGISEMWSILYYIFTFLKGIMLFTVILLIGSGYSLMKNYLHEREKQIIMVVGALQVIDNIAMIILEETAPGSQGWLTWRDILHILDIICCLAILIPIVWSIKHLRQAAEVDGKAHHALVKLQLFRTFYVMVVVYIYFTRIAVYLLSATIPYYLLWLGDVSTETATFLFFVITGYKFRPAIDNPYLAVATEDNEGDSEYGLGDKDDELSAIELPPAVRK